MVPLPTTFFFFACVGNPETDFSWTWNLGLYNFRYLVVQKWVLSSTIITGPWVGKSSIVTPNLQTLSKATRGLEFDIVSRNLCGVLKWVETIARVEHASYGNWALNLFLLNV